MNFKRLISFIGILLITLWSYPNAAQAVVTTPQKINYQGRLLNAIGDPITTPVTFRFSIWSDADFVEATDLDGAGAIPGAAPDFTGYEEVQTITADANGLFNVEIGAVNPLPDLDFSVAKFIQTEIKNQGDPDTAYEILDPDTADATKDRKSLNSSPYTFNADTIDNAEIGTAAGDIVILDGTGKFPVQVIPNGVNESVFVLDVDDDEVATISLQFGTTLAKLLSYDIINSQFVFNDSLLVEGDFTNTGNVTLGDDVNTDTLSINAKLATDLDFNQNEAIALVLETGNVFPLTPVAGQKFFRTDLSAEFVFDGVSWLSTTSGAGLADITVTMVPEYEGFTAFPDGSDNLGTLRSDYEEGVGTEKRTFYRWTTNRATLQDIDIVVKYQLPSDFDTFQAVPLQLDFRTDDSIITNNKIDVSMFDSNGDPVVLVGGDALADANWTTADITFGGAPTFNANDFIVLRIKVSSLIGKFAQIGDLRFNYSRP